MASIMKCGHDVGYMYRLREKGTIKKFCFACVFEKLGVTDMDGQVPYNYKKEYEKRLAKEKDTKQGEPKNENKRSSSLKK